MTAPPKNRIGLEVVDGPEQVDKQISDVDANKLAVQRVISLLNEVVAKGVLPAL